MATETQVQTVIQRPLRGSRISSFYPVKSLPALSSLDSAFQLQEYISLLIRLDVHDVDRIVSLPGANKDVKEKEGKEGEKSERFDEAKDAEADKDKDVTVDEACWIYEQLRRLAQDLTHPLITTLQQECSRTTCPEMKAGEWLYLCVAHGNEGAMEQCCAIDYILHTLDSATALLNSPRAFPSRLQIPSSSHRHFSSLARRLGRIFAHAYFHHREAFEQAEAESSLYARFLALTSKFDLVPPEFLVIPTPPNTTSEDDDEDDEHNRRGSTFGEREVKLGTSYDPRRGLGHNTILRQQRQRQLQQHQQQQQGSFQDDFPDIPRIRRSQQQQQQQQQPQQQQHYQLQPQQLQEIQTQVEPGAGGTESPKKMGRNRTDTMVLSEVAGIVDDLAKAAAAAKAEEERQKEQEEVPREPTEEKEKEARTYADVAAEAVAKEEEQVATTPAEPEAGKDEAEQVVEDTTEQAPSQTAPDAENSIEPPSHSDEAVDEAKEAQTPDEAVVSDSAETTAAVADVEASGKVAEDIAPTPTGADESPVQEETGEVAESAERKLDEEEGAEEDDIGDGAKDPEETKSEPEGAVEGERTDVKSEPEADKETT